MRFDRYMERALYHPTLGYYAGGRRIGRDGDFFTGVSVGPLFGQLLARQARQMWERLERPTPFWIIEQGAHDGRLAIDILEACRGSEAEFFAAVRYALVEPSPSVRTVQKNNLNEAKLCESVQWLEAIAPRPRGSVGLFFSNELVDSFPVRLIRRQAGAWHERHVDLAPDAAFRWVDLPIGDPELQRVIEELPLPEVDGYIAEINLQARRWMKEVAAVFERGYVVTIDYGFPASVLYAPFRSQGTLTSYRKHRRADDILLSPGEHDITAHVDFTALSRSGESAGLATLGFVDQQRFLTGIAHEELSGVTGFPGGISAQLQAWNTLTHPGHLGSRFQVLVQARNAPGRLDGLLFARPGGLD